MANITNRKEVVIGFIMLAAGLAYLLMTINLPRRAFIDAAFVPYVLAVLMCVFGIVQILTGWKAPDAVRAADAKSDEAAPAPAGSVEYMTVVKTLALIVAYVALLAPVGFVISTAVYLYLQFIVLTPLDHKISHVGYLATAIITAFSIDLIFRHGFSLLLPTGILTF